MKQVLSDQPNPFLGLGPNMASYAMGDPKYNYAPLSQGWSPPNYSNRKVQLAHTQSKNDRTIYKQIGSVYDHEPEKDKLAITKVKIDQDRVLKRETIEKYTRDPKMQPLHYIKEEPKIIEPDIIESESKLYFDRKRKLLGDYQVCDNLEKGKCQKFEQCQYCYLQECCMAKDINGEIQFCEENQDPMTVIDPIEQ